MGKNGSRLRFTKKERASDKTNALRRAGLGRVPKKKNYYILSFFFPFPASLKSL